MIAEETISLPRGSVIKFKSQSGRVRTSVLLTDTITKISQQIEPILVGVVQLAQIQGLANHTLYPSIAGVPGNGLAGTWSVRADKILSIYTNMIESVAGQLTLQEMLSVDAAVKLFLRLP